MAVNVFITRKDWQQWKEKHGIPDNVVKYSIGEKLDKFYKRFDEFKLPSLVAIPVSKIPDIRAVLNDGRETLEEYAKALSRLGADKVKPDAKKKGLEKIEMILGLIQTCEDTCALAKDPFIRSRINYDKCLKAFATAYKTPDDPTAISHLYSQGIRNDLGAPFHKALTTYKGEQAVMTLLHQYEDTASKWHDTMQGTDGPTQLAQDPVRRKAFMADMQHCMELGGQILKKTKPA